MTCATAGIYLFRGRMRHLGRDKSAQVRAGGREAGWPGLDLRAWSEALYDLPTGPVAELDFRVWLEGPLRRFFPFRQFFGAYGRLSGNRVQMHALITSGHWPAFVASRKTSFDLKLHGCFAWLVTTRRAVLLDDTGATDAAGIGCSRPNANVTISNGSRSVPLPCMGSSIRSPRPALTWGFRACRPRSRRGC